MSSVSSVSCARPLPVAVSRRPPLSDHSGTCSRTRQGARRSIYYLGSAARQTVAATRSPAEIHEALLNDFPRASGIVLGVLPAINWPPSCPCGSSSATWSCSPPNLHLNRTVPSRCCTLVQCVHSSTHPDLSHLPAPSTLVSPSCSGPVLGSLSMQGTPVLARHPVRGRAFDVPCDPFLFCPLPCLGTCLRAGRSAVPE